MIFSLFRCFLPLPLISIPVEYLTMVVIERQCLIYNYFNHSQSIQISSPEKYLLRISLFIWWCSTSLCQAVNVFVFFEYHSQQLHHLLIFQYFSFTQIIFAWSALFQITVLSDYFHLQAWTVLCLLSWRQYFLSAYLSSMTAHAPSSLSLTVLRLAAAGPPGCLIWADTRSKTSLKSYIWQSLVMEGK